MRPGNTAVDDDPSDFNQIRIDLRGGAGKSLANPTSNMYPRRFQTENDQRSQGSIPSRISRYSGEEENKKPFNSSESSSLQFFSFAEYPQVRPTNPLYSSQSTLKTLGSNPAAPGLPSSKSSATLVNRRQKFDPQAPRRPSDWRWLAILCIVLFFPLGFYLNKRKQRKIVIGNRNCPFSFQDFSLSLSRPKLNGNSVTVSFSKLINSTNARWFSAFYRFYVVSPCSSAYFSVSMLGHARMAKNRQKKENLFCSLWIPIVQCESSKDIQFQEK